MTVRFKLGRVGGKAREEVSAPARSEEAEPTAGLFGGATGSAINSTGRFRRDARRAATDAVSGAVKAADEISGEATVFVRDAVIGVIEGTGRLAKVSRPIVREVAAAAMLSSTELGGSAPESIKQAVEGAVVGAAMVGVKDSKAGAQASRSVVEAAQNIGVDFTDTVSPAIHGVITGVISTSGNLFESTEETARSLMASGAKSDQDVAEVACIIVNEAIRATRLYKVGSSDAVMGAAHGCVEAAYGIDRSTGEYVKAALLALVETPLNMLAPPIRISVSKALSDLTDELGERPQAWRGVALWRAGKLLMRVGGLDSGAALAYYTLLAFFPLTALLVLAFSVFVDPNSIRGMVTEVLIFYFPGAEDFLFDAINHLYTAPMYASLIALAGIAIGAFGLFIAANRGVNRLFGCSPKKLFRTTVSTIVVTSLAVILFLLSIGFTWVFQATLRLSDRFPIFGGHLSAVLLVVTSIVSTVVPLVIAGLVFILVYKYFPNRPIEWKDATFGGFVTVILFEIAKNVFFFVNLFGQRDLLYGPISSVALVLIWSHVAGLIFLYGAALTKQASDLRPRDSTRRDQAIMGAEERKARRLADIALGRAPWPGGDNGWGGV